MPVTFSIVVTGKVQGVYYRQSTRDKALELGLTGEVSNQADSTVLIVATGELSQLEALIRWCRTGPPRSLVAGVFPKEVSLKQFGGFSILR